MASSIDAVSSFETPGDLTWVHNQGDLTNGVILVATGCNFSGRKITAVTYDGVAMTEIASQGADGDSPFVNFWRLAVGDKAAGAYTIVCTKSDSTCSGGACASINGAAQTDSLRDSGGTTGAGTTTNDTLTTEEGDFCMDICMKRIDDNNTFGQGTGETEICDLDANSGAVGNAEFCASYEVASGVSTTLSATWQTTRYWAYLLVAIKLYTEPPPAGKSHAKRQLIGLI